MKSSSEKPVEEHRIELNRAVDLCIDSICPTLKEKVNNEISLNSAEEVLEDEINDFKTNVEGICHRRLFKLHRGKMRNAKDKYIWKHSLDAMIHGTQNLSYLIDNVELLDEKLKKHLLTYLQAKGNSKEKLLIDHALILADHDVSEDKSSLKIKSEKITDPNECIKVYHSEFNTLSQYLKKKFVGYDETNDYGRKKDIYGSLVTLTHRKPFQSLLEYVLGIANSPIIFAKLAKTYDVLDNARSKPKDRQKYDEKVTEYFLRNAIFVQAIWETLSTEIQKEIFENNPIWGKLLFDALNKKSF